MNRSSIWIAVLLAAALATGTSACNKLRDTVKLNLGLVSADIPFTIPVLPQHNTATLADLSVYLNVDSIIRANNANIAANNIRTVKVSSCTLTILNGDAANNFRVLESCRVALASNATTEPVTIAVAANIPDTAADSLSLPVNSDTNLKSYFNTSYYTYRITGTTRRATSKSLDGKLTVTYELEAGL